MFCIVSKLPVALAVLYCSEAALRWWSGRISQQSLLMSHSFRSQSYNPKDSARNTVQPSCYFCNRICFIAKQDSQWENFGRRIDWNFSSQPLVSLGIIDTFMKAKTTYSSWWKNIFDPTTVQFLKKKKNLLTTVIRSMSICPWQCGGSGHVWDDPSTPVWFREILGLIIHAFILWSSCPSIAHFCVIQKAIYALL